MLKSRLCLLVFSIDVHVSNRYHLSNWRFNLETVHFCGRCLKGLFSGIRHCDMFGLFLRLGKAKFSNQRSPKHSLSLCLAAVCPNFRNSLMCVIFRPQFWGWKWLRQFYGRLAFWGFCCWKTPPHAHKCFRFRGVGFLFFRGGGSANLF